LKWLWHKISGGLTTASQYLVTWGPFGLFTIALLDSAMVPLPGGADAVMILLTTARPSWMIFYALAATVGSVIGCCILYYISRRAGRKALARFSPARQARVKELIDRYDVLSVIVASVLPPPFPFKLFVITAGVFRLNVWRFAAAIAAGRLFRFLLEGYLAARYGTQAKELLAHYYPYIGIGLAALIIALFVCKSLWRRKSENAKRDLETGEEAANP
jgi:membrane protein YqaA with SNARE-associated domain